MLLQGGALDDSSWMSYGYPAPVGRLWLGSYIDDVLVLMIAEAVADGRPLRDLDRAPAQTIREPAGGDDLGSSRGGANSSD